MYICKIKFAINFSPLNVILKFKTCNNFNRQKLRQISVHVWRLITEKWFIKFPLHIYSSFHRYPWTTWDWDCQSWHRRDNCGMGSRTRQPTSCINTVPCHCSRKRRFTCTICGSRWDYIVDMHNVQLCILKLVYVLILYHRKD